MLQTERLHNLVMADPWRVRCLDSLRQVMPQGWVGAGFIRNLVWDWLGGRKGELLADVDVVYFDNTTLSESEDKAFEAALAAEAPDIPWSVKNQARMHLKHGDAPYTDLTDGLGHWLETATTVSVRLTSAGRMEILAPYGLDDLMAGVLRPTASGYQRLPHLRYRAQVKGWLNRWPHVEFLTNAPAMAMSPLRITV